MTWDEDKQNFESRDDVPTSEKITAEEWNNHVSDQKNHAGRHESGGSDELSAFDLAGNLVGSGLEKANNTLRVLSSIWDGSAIVADVDNESVNADEVDASTYLQNGEEFSSSVDGEDINPSSVNTERTNSTTAYLESPTPDELDSVAQNLYEDYGGGEIVIGEGEHPGRWYLEWDNITLRGRSKGATLKLPDGTDEPAQTFTLAADHCHLHTLTIDGNKYNQNVDGQGGDLDDSDGIGVYGRHNLIENNTVKESMSHGIIVWGLGSDTNFMKGVNVDVESDEWGREGNVIRENLVRDTGNHNNGRAAIDLAYNVVANHVIRNRIEGGDGTAQGVTTHTGHWSTIIGNYILNVADGLHVHSNSEYVTASANRLEGIGQCAFNIRDGAKYCQFTENTVIGSGAPVYYIHSNAHDIHFANNTVTTDDNGFAFWLTDGAYNISFDGDRYDGPGRGNVTGSNTESIDFNGLQFRNTHNYGGIRIRDGASDVSFNSCRITAENSYGIQITDDSSDVYGVGNVIDSNDAEVSFDQATNVDVGYFVPS